MMYESIEALIGQTPLLKIDPRVHGLKHIDLYAKLEYFNPFGSVKDRIAKSMLAPHWQSLTKEKRTVIESSSGNTGKAIAALCAVHGVPFKTITNRIKVPEQRMIMQLLGADIQELPRHSECPDPSDPDNALSISQRLVATQPETYLFPNQYTSPLNVQAHEQTGHELLQDLKTVDYYIGFLGTAGSTLGAGKVIKAHNPQAKVIGVVAEPNNHLPGGREAQEMWEVGLFDKSFYNHIFPVGVQDSIDGMLMLIRQCGMLCGPTTGANFHISLKYLREQDKNLDGTGPRKTAVFIACDRLEPYMSYLQKHRPSLFGAPSADGKLVSAVAPEALDSTPSITIKQLQSRDPQKTVLIDIRGSLAYALGHVPGSINIVDESFASLIEQGPMFPRDKEIVVICRIGHISKKYAAFLRQQGYEAASFDGGVTAWKAEGLPFDHAPKCACPEH